MKKICVYGKDQNAAAILPRRFVLNGTCMKIRDKRTVLKPRIF